MKRTAHLVFVENDRPVTNETDMKFIVRYQRSVLLALKQAGILSEMQYRHTEEELQAQLRATPTIPKPESAGSCS